LWSRWPALLAQRLRQHPAPDARAAAVAGLLRQLVPQARLAACRLEGVFRADPVGGLAEGEVGTGPGAPSRLALGGAARDLVGLAAPVRGSGPPGFLLLALPGETSGEEAAGVEALLALAAHGLGLELRVEGLREELREWDDLVTVGEAMVGLTHTLNNSLNTMVLQASTLQMRAPPSLSADLGVIRREGVQAAARLRPLQQVREQPPGRGPAELGPALAEVLAAFPAGAARAEVAGGLPPVPAPRLALRRFLTQLLRVALACQRPAGRPVRLRAEEDEGAVRLLLEVDGVSVGPEGLNNLTELAADLYGGMRELERVAAQSLARRLGASVRVTDRPEGGVTVAVRWGDPAEA
jgi:hypothetical protein